MDANRTHRKSPGPKSPEAKARVAKNRLRSGSHAEKYSLYALPQAARLSSKIRHRYYSILDGHLEIFAPTSSVAESYLVAMAREQWRLDIMPQIQAGIFEPGFAAKAAEFEAVFPELHPFLSAAALDRPRITLLLGRLRRECTASIQASLRLFLQANATVTPSVHTKLFWIDEDGNRLDPDNLPALPAESEETMTFQPLFQPGVQPPLQPGVQPGVQQDIQPGDQQGDQLLLPLLPEAA